MRFVEPAHYRFAAHIVQWVDNFASALDDATLSPETNGQDVSDNTSANVLSVSEASSPTLVFKGDEEVDWVSGLKAAHLFHASSNDHPLVLQT